jgi:hypothetical protein
VAIAKNRLRRASGTGIIAAVIGARAVADAALRRQARDIS